MKTETDKIIDKWMKGVKNIHLQDSICFWCVKKLKRKLNELNKDTISKEKVREVIDNNTIDFRFIKMGSWVNAKKLKRQLGVEE